MCSYLVKLSLVLSDSIDFAIITIVIYYRYSESALGTVTVVRLVQ